MNPRSRNANFDRTIGLCSAKTGKARLCCGDRCTNGKMPGRALGPAVLFPCFVGSLILNNIRRGDGRDKAGNRWEVEIAYRRRTVRFPTTAHNHLTTPCLIFADRRYATQTSKTLVYRQYTLSENYCGEVMRERPSMTMTYFYYVQFWITPYYVTRICHSRSS